MRANAPPKRARHRPDFSALDMAEACTDEDSVGTLLSGATATAYQRYDERDQHQGDQGVQHDDHDDEHDLGGII